MSISQTQAFEYRDKCHNETKNPKTTPTTNDLVENDMTQTEEKNKWEEIEVSRDDLKNLLKNAWIEFKWNAKTKDLVDSAIINNLI